MRGLRISELEYSNHEYGPVAVHQYEVHPTHRAMAMRCFCPPLSCAPPSPAYVLYLSGNDSMNDAALA